MNELNYVEKGSLNTRILNVVMYGIGGAIISRAIIMLNNMLIARMLGRDSYGQFSMINSTIQTFILFANIGIGATLSRYIVIYINNDISKVGKYIKTLSRFSIFLSAILSCLILFLSEKISMLTSGTIVLSSYFKISAIVIFITAISAVEQSILQGLEKFKECAIAQMIFCIVSFFSSIILTKYLSISGSIIGLLIGQSANYLMLKLLVLKELKKLNIELIYNLDKDVLHAITKFTIPAFLSSIFVMPITWFANSILIKSTGFAELAVFNIALQWLTIITYIPNQLTQMKPILTDLFNSKKMNMLLRLILKLTGFIIIVILPIVIILSVFSEFILSLYGNNYSGYNSTFIVMMIAALFISTQSQIGGFLQAIGAMWTGLLLNVFWSITLLLVFYKLRVFGALGYAVAYLVSYIIHNILSYMILIKKIKVNRNEVIN